MSTSVAAPQPALAAKHQVKWGWLGVAIAVGLAVAFIPTPAGLTRTAQLVLAIIAGTVVLWAAEVMNNGIASLLMMALLMTVGVRPLLTVPDSGDISGALSGFSDGAWWTLLVVVYYGFAMKKTGLAERIAYYILSLFPGTYAGILSAFFLIGLLLSLGIPSMTVRTAIMAPIAWSLVQTLGLPPRSRGSALIMITVIEMAVVPGLAWELGSLNGPVVVSMFAAKKIPLTWLGYAQFMTVPTLILCGLILVANLALFKPEAPVRADRKFALGKLHALGSFKRAEAITGLVVLISIGFWITASVHHLPTFVVGMFGLAILTLAGIFQDQDIGTGISWTLMLFLGGIFSLTHIIPQYKITNWIAGIMVPRVAPLIGSPVALLSVVGVMMLAMRFIDPTAFIAMPLIWTPLVDAVSGGGIPPLALAAAVLLTSAPFWLLYMNFWMAMGDGMTGKQGYTKGQLAYLGTIYAIASLIALAVAVFYWRVLGLMH
ncbi:MAG: anion permease [Bryobacterales bacterium]|nr:anion permease [Bryobacterales bacterium]MBV9401317.1 anion permease [Bryobacterales bacterium]